MKADGNTHKNNGGLLNASMRVIEDNIVPEVFQEFYELLVSDESVKKHCTETTSKLLELSKSGTIESIRKLEEIIAKGRLAGKESDFAKSALNFCRFRVENELLDIEMDMISGGLGGNENRLRYYVALTCTTGTIAEHIKTMERVFKKILKKNDSILEGLTDHGFYLSVLILGSLNYAIGLILEEIFKECTYLSDEYYLTNVEIPTDDRIRDWLDGKLDDEKQST